MPHDDCLSCFLQFPDDKVLSGMAIHLQLAISPKSGASTLPSPSPQFRAPCCPAPAGRESLLSHPLPLQTSLHLLDLLRAWFAWHFLSGCQGLPSWLPVSSPVGYQLIRTQGCRPGSKGHSFLGTGLEFWEVLCLGRFVSL